MTIIRTGKEHSGAVNQGNNVLVSYPQNLAKALVADLQKLPGFLNSDFQHIAGANVIGDHEAEASCAGSVRR